MPHKQSINCPHCQSSFSLGKNEQAGLPRFCVFCGQDLTETPSPASSASTTGASHIHSTSITLIAGHVPDPNQVKFSIGPYRIIDSIGKGGMGEVFLAYDTTCGRRIALKKIREDLLEHKQLQNRFLKEAHITSQLTHPAVIPIYTIHKEDSLIYYTMPFVEGKTLKEILRTARRVEKKGEKVSGPIITSIPALMRIFVTICNAVAYAHAKGVLHRDLKPENIIVGQYGQVIILDWGLAKMLHTAEDPDQDLPETLPLHKLTRVGKVVGTVAYMAPERALGQPATVQTDIYSLGVILYQLLTLTPPFKRGTLQEYIRNFSKEVLKDPAKVAPYRDIPKALAQITKRCLDPTPSNRYASIDEMIGDLENFLEGRSEWFLTKELDVHRKSDWEFQENVLISEHFAITRGKGVVEWVSLMISRQSFTGNTRIETRVRIHENGIGIGFMLCVPEAAERQHLNDGYCVWLATKNAPPTRMLRSTMEVISRPEITLEKETWYKVTLEKVDNNIHVYLNDVLQFSYISHIPVAGTHIGLLCRDANFTCEPIQISISSLNIMVNCLAVPDAFLAHKDYAFALNEYRRIAYSFPGRAEGREALFKAGITLLEKAKNAPTPEENQKFCEQALEEFSKQHNTPGAPLEYLGKGLVYQTLKDYDEEAKCYELAFRRYQQHPLLSILNEQIVYRMYEASKSDRKATYTFVLLALRYLPKQILTGSVRKLFESLQEHWEHLDFILTTPDIAEDLGLSDRNFTLQIAFWLAKPYVISEIINELLTYPAPSSIVLTNALFCLLELGSIDMAQDRFNKILETLAGTDILDNDAAQFHPIVEALNCHSQTLNEATSHIIKPQMVNLSTNQARFVFHLLRSAQKNRDTSIMLETIETLGKIKLDQETLTHLHYFHIWALLWEKKWGDAGDILHLHPLETLCQENSPLYFLYGCWLLATEGKEIADIHFAGVIEMPYPRTWTLFAHNLRESAGVDSAWENNAFLWEKRYYYQQLSLYFKCVGDQQASENYYALEKQQYVQATL